MKSKIKNFLQYTMLLAFCIKTINTNAQCNISNLGVNLPFTCPDAVIHCTADAAGNFAEGDAWIKYGVGNGGQLKKPFIFVEGLDLDINSDDPYRHGRFGWPNFITGTSDEKDPTDKTFEKAPLLINELLARGYDVIFLDHSNGATYMQHNAGVFVDLIKKINVQKVGNEQIIVAGASMGGQTVKYGISLMEYQNYKHCIADYISIDSPHQGANIPLGLQALIKHYKFIGAKIEVLYNSINLPAVRQLLLSHIDAAANNQPHS